MHVCFRAGHACGTRTVRACLFLRNQTTHADTWENAGLRGGRRSTAMPSTTSSSGAPSSRGRTTRSARRSRHISCPSALRAGYASFRMCARMRGLAMTCRSSLCPSALSIQSRLRVEVIERCHAGTSLVLVSLRPHGFEYARGGGG